MSARAARVRGSKGEGPGWRRSRRQGGQEAWLRPGHGSRPGEIPGIPGWQSENHLWRRATGVPGKGLFHPHGAQFGRSVAVNACDSVLRVQLADRGDEQRGHHNDHTDSSCAGTAQRSDDGKRGRSIHHPGAARAIPGLAWWPGGLVGGREGGGSWQGPTQANSDKREWRPPGGMTATASDTGCLSSSPRKPRKAGQKKKPACRTRRPFRISRRVRVE